MIISDVAAEKALLTPAQKRSATMRRKLGIMQGTCHICGEEALVRRDHRFSEESFICGPCRKSLDLGKELREIADRADPTDFSDLDELGLI